MELFCYSIVECKYDGGEQDDSTETAEGGTSQSQHSNGRPDLERVPDRDTSLMDILLGDEDGENQSPEEEADTRANREVSMQLVWY